MLLDFFILEHFFQFILFIVFSIILIVRFISNGIVTQYPELLMDGLTIFKILKYPFKNKFKNANEHVEKVADKVEFLNDKLENALRAFNAKTFDIIIIYLGLNILVGYAAGLIFVESSVLLNTSTLIVFLFYSRLYKKIRSLV